MDDDLQMAWDTALVRAYFETPNKNTSKVIFDFKDKNNIESWDTFNALKRVPRYGRQSRCVITRYVYAYLPNIAKALTAHGPSKMIDLILAVNKSKNDTYSRPQDEQKAAREGYDRKQSRLQAAAATLSLVNSYEANAKTSGGGQWKIVK